MTAYIEKRRIGIERVGLGVHEAKGLLSEKNKTLRELCKID